MMNFSTFEVKRNLLVQILILKHNLDDENFIEFLRDGISEDMDIYFHDFEHAFNTVFNFTFVWDYPDWDVRDIYQVEHEYTIVGTVFMPQILPYINDDDFEDFANELQVISRGRYDGNLLEFVYLPTSLLNEHEEEHVRDFANRPGTFMIGMQDSMGMSIDETVEFLLELYNINTYLQNYLDSKQRREIA
ncbi:hypothetical protein AAAC51_06615 [Priestia megaterium]